MLTKFLWRWVLRQWVQIFFWTMLLTLRSNKRVYPVFVFKKNILSTCNFSLRKTAYVVKIPPYPIIQVCSFIRDLLKSTQVISIFKLEDNDLNYHEKSILNDLNLTVWRYIVGLQEYCTGFEEKKINKQNSFWFSKSFTKIQNS